MLNYLWLGLLLTAVLIGGFTGRLGPATDAGIKAAETAVTLAIGLVGVMTLWLGLMRLAERSGLVALLARGLRPVLTRLFPDVPADHPAMGSMVLNIAANMLGLTNAATPLGLRAMRDLETLNRRPGTATNAMCTFLAINTGSVQLLPVSAIALFAAAGARQPAAIVGTTLLATTVSSLAGLIAVKTFEKLRAFRLPEISAATADPVVAAPGEVAGGPRITESVSPLAGWAKFGLAAFVGCFVWFGVRQILGEVATTESVGLRMLNTVSLLAIPILVGFFPLYAALRRVPVYEEFIEGAKDGFAVAVKIIPYLVGMLVAIGFLRGAGVIEQLTLWTAPILGAIGVPSELLPLALMRPLSGSGSLAALGDLIQHSGPDSLVARMGGTLFGSTETTFYVIAVYFGAVGVKRVRHAIWAGLIADAAGILAAVYVCRWAFGA
ncbi:MAG TPA: nucleoside recognition domain-containing protein [Verrucomicrobiota bacterium]|nr:nucleoside recognition protein [Verrucomicrobiales bacterium]HRI15745.1 nucleoside recognition domain-containing protein [Verrucomicrobiota bacterium]